MADGAVAAGHAVTANAAADVLRSGGNAFDATIAALWTACIAEPVLASPAGGGFLIARKPGARPELFDFFVSTPLARARGPVDFTSTHADFGTARQEFHIGAGSVATPGMVAGLFAVHEALATLPMAELARPAVETARTGVEISPLQARLAEIVGPILMATPASRRLYAPEGALLEAGEVFTNPELADTLELIAQDGAGVMRDGGLADAVIARIEEGGGHLTHGDLARYEVARREPIARAFDGLDIWTNPAPAAGGLMVLLTLSLLGPAREARALAEAIDRADRIRRGSESADAAPVDAALVAELTRIAGLQAFRGTTHVSVIDAEGNAAAATITNGEGNGQMVAGFMLNNMLGEADLMPAGFGSWREGVRLASMMAPTLIERDGAFTVLGSGGSNRIRSAMAAVIAHLSEGVPLGEAIARPRLHVEDGHLDFEDWFPANERARLAAGFPGHLAWAEPSLYFGGVHAAGRQADGTLEAVGDARRGGIGLVVR